MRALSEPPQGFWGVEIEAIIPQKVASKALIAWWKQNLCKSSSLAGLKGSKSTLWRLSWQGGVEGEPKAQFHPSRSSPWMVPLRKSKDYLRKSKVYLRKSKVLELFGVSHLLGVLCEKKKQPWGPGVLHWGLQALSEAWGQQRRSRDYSVRHREKNGTSRIFSKPFSTQTTSQ